MSTAAAAAADQDRGGPENQPPSLVRKRHLRLKDNSGREKRRTYYFTRSRERPVFRSNISKSDASTQQEKG